MLQVQPEDQMLVDFELTEMTDHEFAAYCRERGWEGETNVLKQWTQFILPSGTVVALVRYKNDAPVNRWIYVPREAPYVHPAN